MQHDWLIDVMADLRTFADAKGLRASAAALDDALLVTLAELTSRDGADPRSHGGVEEHDRSASNVAYLFAERKHA